MSDLVALSQEVLRVAAVAKEERDTLKTANARLEEEIKLCKAQRDRALDYIGELKDTISLLVRGTPDR